MLLSNKTIVLGITGGIAAYKMPNVAHALVKLGADVHVLMTKNATEFISPLVFETLTRRRCQVDTFDRNFQYDVAHISLANAADFVRMVRLSLQMLVTGQAGVKDISGPVGIVSVITDVGQSSGSTSAAVRNIAYLAAMIAVNLAVMNLLPLPALDGGKILFLVINALCMLVIRKRIPQKFESYVHVAGFALLMLLMLAVTFQDVWKIFQ